MSGSFYVNSKIPDSISFNNAMVDRVYYNDTLVWDRRNRLVKFSSPSSFNIQCYISSYSSNSKVWKGTMEYSTDNGATWQEWEQNVSSSNKGTKTIYASKNNGEYTLLFRGIGNTYVCGDDYDDGVRWYISGSNVKGTGNLETLLDYQTVAAGGHPSVSAGAFMCMFDGQTALVEASFIFPTSMPTYVYQWMFRGCTNLRIGPETIYTTGLNVNQYACYEMFSGCSKLTKAPSLPSTCNLSWYVYEGMFEGCISLTETPLMGISTYPLDSSAYERMFYGCTGLRKIQTLPFIEQGTLNEPTDTLFNNMYGSTGILFSGIPTDVCNVLAYPSKYTDFPEDYYGVYYTNVEVFYPET